MLTNSEQEKAKSNKNSRKRSNDFMCRECIYGDHEAGTWRKQAEECPARGCPLWNFRPMSENRPYLPRFRDVRHVFRLEVGVLGSAPKTTCREAF